MINPEEIRSKLPELSSDDRLQLEVDLAQRSGRISENIADWFFRLNGCLTVQSFKVHGDRGNDLTDIDVVAVRFPYRVELEGVANLEQMQDAEIFDDKENRIQIFLVEVKSGVGNGINRSWFEREHLLKAVKRIIAVYKNQKLEVVVDQLLKNWFYRDELYYIRVVSISRTQTMTPLDKSQQLTWKEHVLPFIYERFRTYKLQKASNSQWDAVGRWLFQTATVPGQKSEKEFIGEVLDHSDHYGEKVNYDFD